MVNAHWEANADLDLSIVTPTGQRVSWMGGRADVVVGDAASSEREQLALKSIKRGNYLIEISRGNSSTGPVHGAIDVTVLGTKKTLPFELLGSRAVVGRLAISLQERLEQITDVGSMVPAPPPQGRLALGTSGDPTLDRVLRARAGVFRACYQRELNRNPSLGGRIDATLTIDSSGKVTDVMAGGSLGGAATSCVERQLRTLRFPAQASRIRVQVPMTFTR